jgi:hypothetical protein
MLKTADGKAATSERPQASLVSYVETWSEVRTKLAARFQHPSKSVGL